MQAILEYKEWRFFEKIIKIAIINAKNSGIHVDDHFVVYSKMVEIGSGAKREQIDYKLTRYACYITVLNANPHHKAVSLGKTYFAIQTRRQELSEQEYELLTEDEKRFYKRDKTKLGNHNLNQEALKAGVTMPENLPTPQKSLKQLEKEGKRKLKKMW